MYYSYAIQSQVTFRFYYGHTHDLDQRLRAHNSGKTKSNKAYAPFKLVYFEEFATRDEAILRERYYKTAAGRRFIKRQIGR